MTKPTYLTFDIESFSLNELKEKHPQHIYSYWFKDEKFADEKPLPGTYDICFDYPDSINKPWDEQCKLLKKDESVPITAVVAQALIQHYEKTGEKLLADNWARTNDIASHGNRVYVGFFDAYGLNVFGGSDGNRGDYLGLSSARNFRASKFDNSKPLETLELAGIKEINEKLDKLMSHLGVK